MWVRKDQKDDLQKLKKHKNQPDYEILDMLLEAYEQTRVQFELEPTEGIETDG